MAPMILVWTSSYFSHPSFYILLNVNGFVRLSYAYSVPEHIHLNCWTYYAQKPIYFKIRSIMLMDHYDFITSLHGWKWRTCCGRVPLCCLTMVYQHSFVSRRAEGQGRVFKTKNSNRFLSNCFPLIIGINPVSYTHLTLPTIYSV